MASDPRQNPGPDHIRKEVSATEARQGVISGRVLLVLIVSLVVVVIAFIVGWYVMR